MAAFPPEVTQPFKVLDALFSAAAQACPGKPVLEFHERAHFENKLGLADEDNYSKVPCLNDVGSIDEIPPFTLVRYRCLVQDVFEQEIFDSVLEEVNDLSGACRLVSSKYRECVDPGYGCYFREIPARAGLGDRGVCYCVPLPGETEWARQASKARAPDMTRNMPNAAPTPTQKRPRETDVEMMPELEIKKPMQGLSGNRANDGVQEVMMDGASNDLACGLCFPGGGGKLPANADEFGLNLPLPWEEKRGAGASAACIVKLYDDLMDKVRICQTIEVVGVLCVQPELATFNDTPLNEDSDMWRDARNPSTSLVPRIHAITCRQLPFFNATLPYSPDFLNEERLRAAWQRSFESPALLSQARTTLLQCLGEHLGGDALAAEYVAMLLVARSFGVVEQKLLGTWSMNITGWPLAGGAALAQAIGDLVQCCVHHQISVESLNNDRWKPKKDFVLNRLVASRLQLAAGSALILDESVMNEGNLNDVGVRSFQAIEQLVKDHRLACDFMSYDVPLPLELTCLVVSKGRSLVQPMDVDLPLEPKASVREQHAVPAPGSLDAARFLVALLTRSPRPIKLDQQMTDRITADFADSRAADPSIPQEMCHLWLSLARAFCLTHGCDELTPQRWEAVRDLERQRLARCKARQN
eukprot:gnl/MRDRNA2_/MRDRNA2_55042_c0_seq1.p1 gnl/MRDRNA2_/MRDRNA2_55042_c0~~gnl/MRDRNA2_/MRDRNA2_55042_c0_seq1.p1  ORF type:complete len:667 (-),score=101.00 gnl/MRDRNA2_/MRDRNA2_55042_c0_seq1:56-1981(-)